MGISALKTVLRNIENSLINRRKTAEKLRQKRKVNLKKNYDEFVKVNSIFNQKPSQSQKYDSKNTVYVPRY